MSDSSGGVTGERRKQGHRKRVFVVVLLVLVILIS